MILLSHNVSLSLNEIEFHAIRAQGNGGQNVNKVSSAVHLRFDVVASSLPEFYKERLLSIKDQRLNKDGIIVLKAQQYRTLEQNKEDAIVRLTQLIKDVVKVNKPRKATKPTRSSQKKRVDSKTKRGTQKKLRQAPII